MRTTSSRSVLAILIAALLSACSSVRVQGETLPFHVAVVPFECETSGVHDVDGEQPEDDLRFDSDVLASEIARSLDGLSFTRVTQLQPPPGVTPEELASWDEARRDAHWVEAARASGADMLLCARWRASPWVDSELSPRAAAFGALDGFLKFLAYASSSPFSYVAYTTSVAATIGGWRIESRQVEFDVAFDAAIHALPPLLNGAEASLRNRRAEVLRVFANDKGDELRFYDRSGFLGYIASFVVPSPFLPSSPTVMRSNLRRRIAERVVVEVVEELEQRKGELMRGDGIFTFEVSGLRLVPGDAGHVVLECDVALSTWRVDRMDGYRIWIGERLEAEGSFGPGETRSEGRGLHHLRVPISDPGDAPVRLELRDGALRQGVRTFTLLKNRTGRVATRQLDLRLPERPHE